MNEIYQTAIHEAGHAVAVLLDGGEIAVVTIIPDEKRESSGHIKSRAYDTTLRSKKGTGKSWYVDKTPIEPFCMLKLSGMIAEEIVSKRPCKKYDPDGVPMYRALVADDVQQTFNFLDKVYNFMVPEPEHRSEIAKNKFIDYFINYMLEKTRNRLTPHVDVIKDIAAALMTRKTLTGDQVKEIYYLYQTKKISRNITMRRRASKMCR